MSHMTWETNSAFLLIKEFSLFVPGTFCPGYLTTGKAKSSLLQQLASRHKRVLKELPFAACQEMVSSIYVTRFSVSGVHSLVVILVLDMHTRTFAYVSPCSHTLFSLALFPRPYTYLERRTWGALTGAQQTDARWVERVTLASSLSPLFASFFFSAPNDLRLFRLSGARLFFTMSPSVFAVVTRATYALRQSALR